MDRSLDWPWSWEEEVEWKADLEERDYAFLEELINNAVEDIATDSQDALVSAAEQVSEDVTFEDCFVTA